MIRLEEITSLADLAFKAKTNKYYKQLTVIAVNYFDYSSVHQTLRIKDDYEKAYVRLHQIATNVDRFSCKDIVNSVNYLRDRVIEEKEPTPPAVKAIPTSIPVKEEDVSFRMLKERKCSYNTEGYYWPYDKYYNSSNNY